MRHFILLDADTIVNGILTIEDSETSIDDFQFDTDVVNEVIEISEDLFNSFNEITTSDGNTKILYDKVNKTLKIEKIVVNEEKLV